MGDSLQPAVTLDVAGLLSLLVGLIVAYYVHRDAARSKPLVLAIPPAAWAILSFIEPAWGLVAYWLLNRSGVGRTS
jgi:hypothetical protein